MVINSLKLAALMRASKEAKEKGTSLADAIASRRQVETGTPTPTGGNATGMHGEAITYNLQQQQFIDTLSSGSSCVLIGAAGTGKTTCTQGAIKKLIQTGTVPILQPEGHKHLAGGKGSPGIVTIAYTRRAVNNIRKVLPSELKGNCITAHKLLEYAPEEVVVYDAETGEDRTTKRFMPQRNEYNPLPTSIHTIIIEESSMLGTDLYEQLVAALSHKVQWVFIGDIQQLPPVFGPAILGFGMIQLPVVELTQVYRQALESPIIKLAHHILAGDNLQVDDYETWSEHENLTIHPWKKRIPDEYTLKVLDVFFSQAVESGDYDPEDDMILLPFNKGVGTIELNNYLANYLARRRGAITHEIIVGFNKTYLSAGDKVLYDKEDAEILEIAANPTYTGARYQPASQHLDYWGTNQKPSSGTSSAWAGQDDEDFLLSQVSAAGDDRVRQASHKVTLLLKDSGREITITGAGDLNTLLHAYALTVHKSQGSEWRKVFIIFHHTHATMVARELLYTAVTRAREELYIICEPDTMQKGITRQRITGSSLAEKAEHFKGKKDGKEHNYVF